MRLDKFLKVSRLVKRRTLAKELCDQGRVAVNGRTAKSGTQVAVGDRLTLHFAHKILEVEIQKILESPRKDEASQLYTLVSEQPLQREEDPV